MHTLNFETLSEERLRKTVDPDTYQLGQELFDEGQVQIVEVSDQEALCIVKDKRSFHVQFQVTRGHILLKCSCPHASRGLVCEHDVASWLALREHFRLSRPGEWKKLLNQMFDSILSAPSPRSASPYLLFFSLQKDNARGWAAWQVLPYQMSFKSLPEVIRNAEQALDAGRWREYIESDQDLSQWIKSPYYFLEPAGCINGALESVNLANILLERQRAYSQTYDARFPLENYLALIQKTQSPLFLGDSDRPLRRGLQILPVPGEVQLSLEKDEHGLRLSLRLVFPGQDLTIDTSDLEVVLASPAWALADRYLFRLENQTSVELLSHFSEMTDLFIPAQQEKEFLDQYLLELAQNLPLVGNGIAWETILSEPTLRLYLSENHGEIQAQLRFGYGEAEVKYEPHFPLESLQRKPGEPTLLKIQRQPEVERSAHDSLSSTTYGLKRAPFPAQPGMFRLRTRTHPVDFLLNQLPRLREAGYEIFGEETLKTARVNRNQPTISFDVSSEIDWFDLKAVVNFGELEVSLNEIRRVMRKRERFIKLADGSIGEIPEVWFEQYKHLFAVGENAGESLHFSRHHITLIDQALASAHRANADLEFQRRREKLRAQLGESFKGITPVELPLNFTGELRPYQKAGYDWLHFLHEFEFGGCLADDMGLGKTIQALAFLQSIYRDPHNGSPPDHASLLVVPRSLMVNWQREAARFTPRLRILEYFEAGRPKEPQAFDAFDLVITTYGVMLRDIQTLHRYTFYYAILDEPQVIKNPLSQTARAAHLLQAKHRLVLTGTPIENTTTELWSQFTFLNPGLLGSLKYFKTEFSAPIEKKGDEETAQTLRKLVYPFILRRTKDQVAPELPPRTERILYSDMDSAQSKLYNRTRDYYRGLLLGMLEKEGMTKSRMKILEGLLRLRQISNHPLLVDENFRGGSGKFELLTDTLETLLAEGHKALVFSQFVQMLKLVRKELDQRRILYTYLDGQTQDRQGQVDIFQSDPTIPFFLISLKAGGLGLNLTAADYVIHIDPWWNPAVETQASDRTHRIGQEKPVFIFKLIARDTVEEKILILQERKRNLVEQIITTERAFFKSLTAEDVQVLFS